MYKQHQQVKKLPYKVTFLSGDACTRELWRFPLLSFFSGVQTPGSVWVERSDSAESPALFFQTEVPLLCSVSLLCGKTKVSSSEPARENKTSVVYWVHLIRRGILGVTYMMGGDVLQLLPLVLESGAGVHGQDPLVFLCFFKHSIPTRSLQCLWQFIPQSESERKRNVHLNDHRSVDLMLSTTKQRNVFFVILGNSDYCLMLIKLWSYLYSGSLALWLPTATRGKTWLIWYCSLVDNSYKITDTVYILTKPPQVSQNFGRLYVVSWKLCASLKLKPSLAHIDIPLMK